MVPPVTRRRPPAAPLGVPFVLDTGAVIALSRLDKTARTMLAAALREQSQVWVPAPVITELIRGDQRRDAAVNRVLKSVGDVHPLDESLAREAGVLLADGGTTVDAMVVATARRVAGTSPVVIMTSDPGDISALAGDDSRIRVAAV
ncbi:PIN domain-containing protein [Frankia sp. AgB1.9]|uniref:PIN domain-containing protein n=1 Tax=unclassified Frankia TaxID=2632575 RepID=UPI00193396A2|nr:MULTISPECIES: PIN domain-containing protein [unclassified Frankia]MBL7488896.1 PIN domain-containing protein [Frankia sp. AgW1.1]MBL7547633.1 PIN domain-containing protein [Frankia sp. AgB1.9]MBL7623420.1 PIN domain-containing protein [Frankia sp. AgB1.8]